MQRPDFFRNSALWVTYGSCGVVLLLGVVLAVYDDDALEDVGLLRLVLLVVAIALLGVAVHLRHIRSIERSVVHPLHRLADGTKAIAAGADVRMPSLGEATLQEVQDVADAVNQLAEKASLDIEELKKLEQMRSEFLGNVSHELRTPIFSVQGYLETLLDGAVDDPEVNRQFLEKAYQNAQRLNLLLGELIEISRIESGDLQLSFRHFDLTEVISDVVTSMENRARQGQVALSIHTDHHSSNHVLADKERIAQVLTNLIDNAIKYNEENGSVVVSTTRVHNNVRVSVADTGIGIDPQHHERLFERFYRIDKDRARQVGGSGLGLAIVKHILEAHHSKIEVVSNPSGGTTMMFELPAA